MVIKNTRGIELAIGTIAIIAVVLLVIIVVIGFFMGGFGTTGGGLTEIGGQAGEEAGKMDIRSMIKASIGMCKGTTSFDCHAFCKSGGTCSAGHTMVSSCSVVGCSKSCFQWYGYLPTTCGDQDGQCVGSSGSYSDTTTCDKIRDKNACEAVTGCSLG